MNRKHNFKDRTGQRFGRLVAIKYVPTCKWECACDCGARTVVRTEHLSSPVGTRSCGCLTKDVNSSTQRKLKTKHGLSQSCEYWIWSAMKARCINSKHKEWNLYGGRGVRVCDRWLEFENFYADMGPRPSRYHSLDRIDNGLLYSKSTCRWATAIEQHNNTRRNRVLSFNGINATVAEWARRIGVNYSTLHGRLQRGWALERALS